MGNKNLCLIHVLLIAWSTSGCAAAFPSQEGTTSQIENCPVTLQAEPGFTPPESFSGQKSSGYFWYGSMNLWTLLPIDGVWAELPKSAEGYSQKVFWWSQDYSIEKEPLPKLSVSGQRLDGNAPELIISPATNAFSEDIGSAMLVGIVFPTAGCWEITGRYDQIELSFVIGIKP